MALPASITPFHLTVPIQFEGKELSKLDVRRPTVRDNMIAGKREGDFSKEVTMISLTCSLDEESVLDLDMADFEGVQNVLMGFRKKPEEDSESTK